MSEPRKKREESNIPDKHDFWDTQPVPKTTVTVDQETPGPIDAPKTVEEIRKDPFNLPTGFEWVTMDVKSEEQVKEIYTLLAEHYVEDDDGMFRFDYSIVFLQWALQPPGWRADWHVGVRASKSQKLVGFITGIPAKISVREDVLPMVEINFLCVHKKLREKRLAPVLIREITRRVNLTGIWQAVYTAGKVIPKPIVKARYWHRSLNPKKLIDVGFSHLAPRMTMSRTLKLYQLPPKALISGIRPCTEADVPSATRLLNKYLEQFVVKAIFDEEEFKHWFLPRPNIISCYVVTDSKGEVTDLVSWYTLPSSILGHATYKTLKAAYSFYNIATSVSLTDLVRDGLICAKEEGFDVFNCLDIMHNEEFLQDLHFGKGDGNLHYYLYNWKCGEMKSGQIGLVLL